MQPLKPVYLQPMAWPSVDSHVFQSDKRNPFPFHSSHLAPGDYHPSDLSPVFPSIIDVITITRFLMVVVPQLSHHGL